jgi:hypothetical protein
MIEKVQFESAVNEIRTSDAVVILGAGASFMAGMPLAGQLTPLIWHALEAHPNVLREVCDSLGIPYSTAKNAVGDDSDRSRIAFARIASDSDSRRTFQHSFATLNREREGILSPAHVALARLLHAGRVLRVVSLNWDTLLETAFIRRYGIGVNAQGIRLWKPHGDCLLPDEKWLLPHEPGYIPEAVVKELTALATERPRALLIIGYSERDEVVLERLIRPLAKQWRVFRISPDAISEGAIRLCAPDALHQLAATLCAEPDLPGWDFVSFENQRGIEAAVAGERLGPRDVDTCPRLPHYDSARRSLELLHVADIAGAAGCGKSITAWHLAREYNRQGWEVLRPDPAHSQDVDALIHTVGQTSWKRVLVIDDTQIFPSRLLARLAEMSGPNLKLILTTTDPEGEKPNSVRIPAKIAVETLSGEFLRRRDELLPIVRRFDPHVGDEYLAIPIERRIEAAGKSDTPWQFAFVLRGGWLQAHEQLNMLRDFNRADLLLVLIAAHQLLSLDAGSVTEDLVSDAAVIGRTGEWVRAGIDLLRQQGVILPAGVLRCLHIQAAAVVIRSTLKDRREDTFPLVMDALRRLVSDASSVGRGVSWLLEEILGADAFRYWSREKERFFRPPLLDQLLNKMLNSSEPLARRDAAFLLSRMLWYQELHESRLHSEFSTLARWAESATREDAYAIGDLLNSIEHANKAAAQELVGLIHPETVWACVARARPSNGYGWGHYLSRLAVAAGAEWRARLKSALPKDALLRFISEFRSAELADLAEFVQGIASIDFDFGLECLRRAVPVLQQGFAADALKAYLAISEWQIWLLGHGLFGESRPKRTQRNLSLLFTSGILPDRVAAGIVTCRFGDWETYARLLAWVRMVNRTKHREIVDALDWVKLDSRSSAFWEAPCREFRLLLSCLMVSEDGQPVRKWVAERADRMIEIDPILSSVSPEAAIAVFRKGGRVNLGGHNGSDWGVQARAIARVAQIDRNITAAILEANRDHIVTHLSKLEGIDTEEFPKFLSLIVNLSPPLLNQFCSAIDLRSAAEKWQSVLRDQRKKVRRGARQVLRILSENTQGGIKELAEKLLVSSKARPLDSRSESQRNERGPAGRHKKVDNE